MWLYKDFGELENLSFASMVEEGVGVREKESGGRSY
jgi:hypothetical protein